MRYKLVQRKRLSKDTLAELGRINIFNEEMNQNHKVLNFLLLSPWQTTKSEKSPSH